MSRLVASISDDTALANILVSDAERNAALAANEFDEVDDLSLVGLRVAIGERVGDVVRLYYGLNGKHHMTLEVFGERFYLTRERVRQIKEKAIRRLKHTSRSRMLKSYLG